MPATRGTLALLAVTLSLSAALHAPAPLDSGGLPRLGLEARGGLPGVAAVSFPGAHHLALRGGGPRPTGAEDNVRGVVAIIAAIFAQVEVFGRLSKSAVLPAVATRKLTHIFTGESREEPRCICAAPLPARHGSCPACGERESLWRVVTGASSREPTCHVTICGLLAGSTMVTCFALFPVGHSWAGRLTVSLFLTFFVAAFSLAGMPPFASPESVKTLTPRPKLPLSRMPAWRQVTPSRIPGREQIAGLRVRGVPKS
jgi:hypothetical protein